MIKGKFKPFWNQNDYKLGSWKLHENPLSGFKLKQKNKNISYNNVNAYINHDVAKKFFLFAEKKFKLKHTVVALNKMVPGQILPFHTDLYGTYIKRNKIKNKKDIIRIIVFLQDSHPGHQLWIGDKFCTGPAGSYFGWHYGQEHMAANLGKKDRHTLQITGTNTHLA